MTVNIGVVEEGYCVWFFNLGPSTCSQGESLHSPHLLCIGLHSIAGFEHVNILCETKLEGELWQCP